MVTAWEMLYKWGKRALMDLTKRYIPKRNDYVRVKGKPHSYVVLDVRSNPKTVDVRTSAAPVILYYNVAWSKLSYLPKSHPPKTEN
jgi:hypothetical protein